MRSRFNGSCDVSLSKGPESFKKVSEAQFRRISTFSQTPVSRADPAASMRWERPRLAGRLRRPAETFVRLTSLMRRSDGWTGIRRNAGFGTLDACAPRASRVLGRSGSFCSAARPRRTRQRQGQEGLFAGGGHAVIMWDPPMSHNLKRSCRTQALSADINTWSHTTRSPSDIAGSASSSATTRV